MLGSIGAPEFIFILLIALLIFGPRKLPEIGRTLGKGLGEFRRATNELKRTLDAEMIEEELRKSDPRRILKEDSAKKPASIQPPASPAADPATATSNSGAAAANGEHLPSSEAAASAGESVATEPPKSVERTVARGQLEPSGDSAAGSDSPSPTVDTEDGATEFSPVPTSSGGKDQ